MNYKIYKIPLSRPNFCWEGWSTFTTLLTTASSILYTVVVRSSCYSVYDAYCKIKHENFLHIYEYVIGMYYINVWAPTRAINLDTRHSTLRGADYRSQTRCTSIIISTLFTIHEGLENNTLKCHREASIRGTHCTTAQVSHITRYIGSTKPRPCRLMGISTKHLLPPRNHANTHSCQTSSLSTSNQRAAVLRLSWIGDQTAVITLWRVILTWHRGGHDRGSIPLILVTLT